jgi:hypothetical protein
MRLGSMKGKFPEEYAEKHGIELELGGRVKVAKTAKGRLLANRDS